MKSSLSKNEQQELIKRVSPNSLVVERDSITKKLILWRKPDYSKQLYRPENLVLKHLVTGI